MFTRRSRASTPAGSLFNPLKVDLVIGPTHAGEVRLVILQDQPWLGSAAERESLGKKIQNYVRFAAEGHLAARYPEVAGCAWRIVIDSYSGRPDPRTWDALKRWGDDVRASGGDLYYTDMEPPVPPDVVPSILGCVHMGTGESDAVHHPRGSTPSMERSTRGSALGGT